MNVLDGTLIYLQLSDTDLLCFSWGLLYYNVKATQLHRHSYLSKFSHSQAQEGFLVSLHQSHC